MKKSYKPILFLALTLLLIVTAFALINVGIKLKYEKYVLLKDKAKKTFRTESQTKVKLTAEYQTVTSEERIVTIAKSELGLIRNVEPPVVIKYDKRKLEKVEEALKDKYE